MAICPCRRCVSTRSHFLASTPVSKTALSVKYPYLGSATLVLTIGSIIDPNQLNGPGSGSAYLRVNDWDLGTTEPGSSGSPLFDPDHCIVGQLFGGFAACSNDLEDWYGRFYVSWTGGGTSDSR